ncbi:N-acetylglucosamine kinase of eukaryotic type [Rubellimicrobium mesophilum DSM 19309]|uniref:N-acetylglucosamine kinase of eukaryotic type n=1 Tax=Rubellimicrobium mesophilum DSM 19309 TaxID=442562 RepID=A0A017HTB0_9RHOB|nr:N-acetylglucosamine kinase of eukaryotic type [Rubellimicrobium mesophilum DSM 19309]
MAQMVLLLEKRGAGAAHAVAGGSVIVSQPRLWQAFTEGLAELTADRLTPHLFTGSPVEGACRLARVLTSPQSCVRGGVASGAGQTVTPGRTNL